MMLKELMDGKAEATKLSDGEVFEFLVNERHTIRLRSFDNSLYFYLYAKVKELSKEEATKEVLGNLLEANVFSGIDNKTYFAWHKESSSILLMSSFETNSTTDLELQKGIEIFVSALEHWQKKLESGLKVQAHLGEDLLSLLSQKKQVFFS